MNSIGETCNEFKKQYDSCFHLWFAEKFLKGDTNDSMCAPMFKVYQQCVKKAMKEQHIEVKDVEVNHLGTDQEKSVPPRS
ncbi:TP53-regulated inhibitor of apoptosis 1-like isoform X1 [Athalia rosae]|uniref:TP53-regulated inhibitor of apoptosis 1-like isoform X1 n=1 Tax=Athalia rosae TaxID=37344 RepID=UPI000625DA8F|nr:TP53-regulated inhibitor of apoptosis 1-like isoform X1 [Athalia rosae]XP_012255252.1 TP53-regulated inhibitor of apoptosis 1-like isoform X1 [Athalia rosae]XP_020707668.1 TP53-regulated inhibitor of apoptosis 1-like isoform X1 [Athalia rosae]XP_048509416.1 TP53-regulated inhibitor of apoptosis 1-like isoform X1 [Athalia rosae]XP_048509417.1 TP53-regulated inhibitor of apoptosis 1-like isoform X1 [Athalia rosae]XP_048509418.1 TP53-regulated inhibitor of apoptosis 1-like isoform X1 [Athalia 